MIDGSQGALLHGTHNKKHPAKMRDVCCRLLCSGDSDRIQTCNLLIRSQLLYSVELRSRYAAEELVVLCSNLLLLDAGLLT